MEYLPRWLTAESWAETGALQLDPNASGPAADLPEPVREALEVARRYGLPSEVAGMFYPGTHGAPFTQVAAGTTGSFWRLGQHESQIGDEYVFEYVLDRTGQVVLLDPSLQAPRFVNSSLIAFLDALAAWDYRTQHLDDFDELEPDDDEEDDDPAEEARVAFGMAIAEQLRQRDPDAFSDDTWWSRVYEEVEFDVI
ncbi:SUKH-4 family immunity protein [Micromonospora sp. NPDC005806]|uniref:SUKH-4 family immunity protein n=1 Tax=Micromonospora sp. NPDC005806 TaxID=3364234 RepID=UPI00369EF2BE